MVGVFIISAFLTLPPVSSLGPLSKRHLTSDDVFPICGDIWRDHVQQLDGKTQQAVFRTLISAGLLISGFFFLIHLQLFLLPLYMRFQQSGVEPTGSAAIGIIRMVAKFVINLL